MNHKLLFQKIAAIQICLSLALALTASPAAAAPNNTLVLSGPPQIVKIGVIYPFTGALDAWGQEAGPFLEQAAKDINTLSASVKFELVRDTSDSSAAGAYDAAGRLIYDQNVQAIVGLPTSPELLGAMPRLTTENIAVLSSTSTGTDFALMQPDLIYRVMPNELYLAQNMAELVKLKGFTKVAIIHINNGWGTDYANELALQFSAPGFAAQLIAIAPAPLPPSPSDYAIDVQNLVSMVDSLGQDTAVIMVVREGDDLIILNHASNYPSLAEAGWFSAMAGPQILTGTHAGLYLPAGSDFAYNVDLWSQEHYFPRGGLADNLLVQAENSLGHKPRAEHVYLYDAIQVMARAILLAKNYNGVDIAAEIPAATASYMPATGAIFFNPNGDRDPGELAYIGMIPASPYEAVYSAFFYGTSTGTFNILSQPRDLEWLR